jgi:hypothetical protein
MDNKDESMGVPEQKVKARIYYLLGDDRTWENFSVSSLASVADLRPLFFQSLDDDVKPGKESKIILKSPGQGSLSPNTTVLSLCGDDGIAHIDAVIHRAPVPPNTPEFQYPDTPFESQDPFVFDHPHIAMECVVDEAFRWIEEEFPKGSSVRPSPVMIASLSRSGKTRALEHLFNFLLTTKYTPLFVSFNGDSGFELKEGESDLQAFLRGVAQQIPRHKSDDKRGREKRDMVYTKKALEIYLGKLQNPVLLLDELNVIADPPQKELAALLREFFLDTPHAYLCYTSHWILSVSEVLGTRGELSFRGRHPVMVARSQDLKELQRMFAKEKLNVNPSEVVYYCNLPGLIYAVKTGFYPEARFDEFVERERKAGELTLTEGLFFRQFCHGNTALLASYARFTSIESDGGEEKAVWPLCYARPALHALELHQLASLANYVGGAFADPAPGSGLEWEYLARFALATVLYCSTFRFLTERELAIVGQVPSYLVQPTFQTIFLPYQIQTEADAWKFLEEEAKEMKGYVVACVFPFYRSFPIFDGFHAVFQDSALLRTHGYQMKLRNGYPKKNETKFRGVLLRGDPPKSSSAHKPGWLYATCDQVKYFLPFSLRGLMPREW